MPPSSDAKQPRAYEETMDLLVREAARAPVYRPAEAGRVGGGARFVRDGRALPREGEVVDGKYRIEGVLGEGGMGVVFAATQLNTEREVALKWMHPERLEGGTVERRQAASRFAREARIAARIDHPDRVDVFDVGGDPDRPYLVMERLHGESLRARLERVGRMPWAEAVGLLLPVFDLLQCAHEGGVVHRDLKPDNLFLTRAADGGEVMRVLDFGIASLADRDPEEPTLTRTGSVPGTPLYMPLEQLRGERTVDARADIYALSVVLYEMVSGKLPFSARNAADLAVAQARQSPTSLRERVPELSLAAERAVMRGLARDPQARHASMADYRAAVEAASRRRPVHWGRWSLVLLAAAVAVAGLALGWRSTGPSASPAQNAEGPAALTAPPAHLDEGDVPAPRARKSSAAPPAALPEAAARIPGEARATPSPARTMPPRPRRKPSQSKDSEHGSPAAVERDARPLELWQFTNPSAVPTHPPDSSSVQERQTGPSPEPGAPGPPPLRLEEF